MPKPKENEKNTKHERKQMDNNELLFIV